MEAGNAVNAAITTSKEESNATDARSTKIKRIAKESQNTCLWVKRKKLLSRLPDNKLRSQDVRRSTKKLRSGFLRSLKLNALRLPHVNLREKQDQETGTAIDARISIIPSEMCATNVGSSNTKAIITR